MQLNSANRVVALVAIISLWPVTALSQGSYSHYQQSEKRQQAEDKKSPPSAEVKRETSENEFERSDKNNKGARSSAIDLAISLANNLSFLKSRQQVVMKIEIARLLADARPNFSLQLLDESWDVIQKLREDALKSPTSPVPGKKSNEIISQSQISQLEDSALAVYNKLDPGKADERIHERIETILDAPPKSQGKVDSEIDSYALRASR
jgi:hypothetical protein